MRGWSPEFEIEMGRLCRMQQLSVMHLYTARPAHSSDEKEESSIQET
jgi:hypothetical protein